MNESLRVVIADDERPARSFLAAMLRGFEDVTLIGEAEDGAEAIEVIERRGPTWRSSTCKCPKLTDSAWCGCSKELHAARRLRHGLRRIRRARV